MQDRIGMRQTFSVHSTMYAGILYRLNRVCAADNIRARAVGVATVVNWSANLTVSATFLSLMETIGFDGTFLIYTCVGALSFAFIYRSLPETKGATLEEVQRILATTSSTPRCCSASRPQP
eukprot:m.609612 g.609612  ORF g.609612 m.609612 type:complete len:121 (+) comp22490_c0_seq8:2587-2949(+)